MAISRPRGGCGTERTAAVRRLVIMTESGAGLAERLERGEILFYPAAPFAIPDAAERVFLARQELGGSVHKNISYDPLTDRLHGFSHQSPEQVEGLRRILASFS